MGSRLRWIVNHIGKIDTISDSLKYVPVAWINKPTSSFMDKVVRGLKVFLSPPR